jgi:hypothetical protein
VLADVVAEVAALAEVGKILGPDVILVVLVGTDREGLTKVCGGENDDAAGDWMRVLVLSLAPLTKTTRPAANDANYAPPVARVSFPIDWHDSGFLGFGFQLANGNE